MDNIKHKIKIICTKEQKKDLCDNVFSKTLVAQAPYISQKIKDELLDRLVCPKFCFDDNLKKEGDECGPGAWGFCGLAMEYAIDWEIIEEEK